MSVDITKLTVEEIMDLKRQLGQIKFQKPTTPEEISAMQLRLEEAATWDWTKTTGQLAHQYGLTIGTVKKYRDALGKPKITKWSQAALNWDYSKSDTQISREVGVNLVVVRRYRQLLGKPRAVRDCNPIPKYVFVPKTYDHFDFKNKSDIELSKEHGCTREYVRQIRARLGHPKRLASQLNFERFCKAFDGATELYYPEINLKYKIATATFYNYCFRAGIKIIKTKFIKAYIHPWKLINFDLPNKILTEIWEFKHFNSVAAHRCNNHLQKPLFKYVKGKYPDKWQSLIEAERAKQMESKLTQQTNG